MGEPNSHYYSSQRTNKKGNGRSRTVAEQMKTNMNAVPNTQILPPNLPACTAIINVAGHYIAVLKTIRWSVLQSVDSLLNTSPMSRQLWLIAQSIIKAGKCSVKPAISGVTSFSI